MLGLAEEQCTPFPRQRLEPSVLTPEMITRKKSATGRGKSSLLHKTSVSTRHKHLRRG